VPARAKAKLIARKLDDMVWWVSTVPCVCEGRKIWPYVSLRPCDVVPFWL
jgi:hypothetical protein